MKRLMLSVLVALVAFAATAAERIVPLRRHSITPQSDYVHIFRFDQNDPLLMIVNRSDRPSNVDVGISDATTAAVVRRVSLLPNEEIPLAALLSPVSDAMVVIDADRAVDVVTFDGARFVLRNRRMGGGDALIVERVLPEPVPFFVANVSPMMLHVDIECDGRHAAVDVGGGQIADFADLFSGFSLDATSAVIRSSTPGAQWFAGLSRSRFGVHADASPPPRRRAVRHSPNVADCPSALSAYQAALAEMQQFVKTPIDVPTPPKADYSCSDEQTIDGYVETVMSPENSRITTLLTLARQMELLGCPPSYNTDIAPLLSRLSEKQKLLPPLGDVPEKHVPILTAMLEIERRLQLLGYDSGNLSLISSTASGWLPADEQYYLKRITEQHDYKGASTVINLAHALFLVTGDDSNLEQLFQKLEKAMTFRLKITVETIATYGGGITMRNKSTGEGVLEGVGIKNPSGGEIIFTEEKGTATYAGQTCTFTPGPRSISGAYVPFDVCSTPAVKIRIQGFVGAAPGGTWSCPAGPPPFNGSIDSIVRAAFNIEPVSAPPKDILFDDNPIHAPAFQNLSATPIDDVWSGTGTWLVMTCQAQVHITMTHEPKQ